MASIYHSFLYLNLLEYPPNTVPSVTNSGFTVIGFSSVLMGGVGKGVGVGYSGSSVFGNSVGGGTSFGLSKLIFLHDIVNIIIKINIKFFSLK